MFRFLSNFLINHGICMVGYAHNPIHMIPQIMIFKLLRNMVTCHHVPNGNIKLISRFNVQCVTQLELQIISALSTSNYPSNLM